MFNSDLLFLPVFHRFILMVFMLPETENRTLEEIELHFSDKKRSIFDIKIKKKWTKHSRMNFFQEFVSWNMYW